MTDTAIRLAAWAHTFTPSPIEVDLANRALLDTVSVAVAALDEPIVDLLGDAPPAARWATIAHVLDYDDLHLPSTSHLSAVCVPATLAAGGSAAAYLAGAGVMARVGTILGWPHYSRGWHATCTTGALGAAVAAGRSHGLDEAGLARAIALAVPAAGGVQRAFGTMAKSLQVGFAAAAGVRAAQLARDGATADPSAFDQWFALVRGEPVGRDQIDEVLSADVAVPGGLAIKVFPCCYALQRPICAVAELGEIDPAAVERIDVRTPADSLLPLIHHRPETGLEGKFSLEYGIAAALLDDRTGFASFTDDAVRRPAAQRLLRQVQVRAPAAATEPVAAATQAPTDLLVGAFDADIWLSDGTCHQTSLVAPLGSPARPLTADGLREKVADCCGDRTPEVLDADWISALPLLEDAVRAGRKAESWQS